MVTRIILGTALALAVGSPSFAGPCLQRLAEVEKSIIAQHEGGGPALANPTTTGATSQSSPASPGQEGAAERQKANQAMQMVQQAKQLDQQGKAAESIEMVTKITATAKNDLAPPAPK